MEEKNFLGTYWTKDKSVVTIVSRAKQINTKTRMPEVIWIGFCVS